MKIVQTFSGDLLVLVAMAIFGSSPLFLRFCPQISPLAFVGASQLVGMASFFIIARYQGRLRLSKRVYMLIAALAVADVLNDLSYFFAFSMTSIANVEVAHQSVSIFLLLLAPFLLGEHTRKQEWIMLAISLVGIVVLYSNQFEASSNSQHLVGITLATASGLCYALIIIFYRLIPDPNQGVTVSAVNFWRYAMSSVLLLPVLPLMKLQRLQGHDLIQLVGFGLIFAVIATGIHTYGINKTRSLRASIIGKSEPVFAIAYAALILHEPPTAQAIIGGILIVGSSLWFTLRKGEQEVIKRPVMPES